MKKIKYLTKKKMWAMGRMLSLEVFDYIYGTIKFLILKLFDFSKYTINDCTFISNNFE